MRPSHRGTAIVLGGSGFVGSACASALWAAGWEVLATPAPRLETPARTSAALEADLPRHQPVVEHLAELFAGVDVVVNAAGVPASVAAESDELFGANALLPGVACAAARRAGVRRLVQLSSIAVQGRLEPLDETLRHQVRSPYARSRALAETLFDSLADDGAVLLRLPAVLSSDSAGLRALGRLARSPLRSTAGRGDRPRPVTTAENVGAAVAFLAAHDGAVPRVVLQPSDGLTTRRLLELLGGRRPHRVPVPVAKLVLGALHPFRARTPRIEQLGRGLELMWLGQRQVSGWLTTAGFVPPVDTGRWTGPLKVGVLSHWYAPELGPNPAPTAARLAERGHDVKVLTGFPNYPTGVVYPGYRQRWSHRERDGAVSVRRVPLYASHDTSGVRRAANFLSFAATSTLARRFLADRDVTYVYGSPLTAATAAAALRLLRGVPFVLHVIDLWPESVLESGMVGGPRTRRLAAAVLGALTRYLYGRAEHVVAVTPGIRQVLLDRGLPADRVSVVPNWSPGESAPRADRDPEVRERLGGPGRILAVFAGNVGQMQDVGTIVAAAALVQDDTPIDVAVIGAGTGFGAARDLAEELGVKNVRFFDRVGVEQMPAVYAASDYQLVTLKDRPLFHVTVPSKFGDALAAGCAVITTVPGDAARMCAEGGFGFACAPEDPDALADVFRRACATSDAALAEMGLLAGEYYAHTLSMGTALDRLDAILADAARAGREPR